MKMERNISHRNPNNKGINQKKKRSERDKVGKKNYSK